MPLSVAQSPDIANWKSCPNRNCLLLGCSDRNGKVALLSDRDRRNPDVKCPKIVWIWIEVGLDGPRLEMENREKAVVFIILVLTEFGQ